MDIHNVIVHKLNKEVKETGVPQVPVTVDLRATELNRNDGLVIKLIEKIAEAFKTGKTFGSFDSDIQNHPFQRWLDEMLDPNSQTTFMDLTKHTMGRLKLRIAPKNFATGGHIIFCYYRDQGKDWFMVVMLKEKDGFSFEDLILKNIQELDIDKLHQLARIDLEVWSANTTSAYLSFINKKPGDISGYFLEALGCTDVIPSKAATSSVFHIIDDIFDAAGLGFEESQIAKENVYQLMEDRRPNSISLPEIAAVVNAYLPIDRHNAFIETANSDEYQISDEFEPNLQALKFFKRIKHKTPTWTLDIERRALGRPNSGADLVFDEQHNTLTINNLPEELVQQIKDSFAPAAEPELENNDE